MALVNLQTDLKSLKFGKDQPGGGSSNQPYIIDPIPDGDLPPHSPDFLLRNGYLSPVAVGKDISRITQMFFDTKSPNGLLFTIKENLLSRISVKTQSTTILNPSYLGGVINQGIYSPTSTLAQVAGEDFGIHLNLLGVDPTGLSDISINDYTKIVKRQTGKWDRKYTDENEGAKNNRLAALKHLKISSKPKDANLSFKDKLKNAADQALVGLFNRFHIAGDPLSILAYGGGPGSILGIGQTRINFADGQRTGYDSNLYNKGPVQFPYGQRNSFSTQNEVTKTSNPIIEDFRVNILHSTLETATFSSIAPDYRPKKNKTLDNSTGNSRVNYTSPGQKGSVWDYTMGKGKLNDPNTPIGPVDRINALPIYQSNTGVHKTPEVNDLVKFRIAAINNTDPSLKDYIHFRAYIDSFSDAYNGSWDAINYMGRGENFWKYNNFKRSINLSFTVAAQSKQELIPMYKKLNFLASNLAPSYSDAGYMAGSLVTLTLGGWCYELPGFITSMTLDIPTESTWEIGIDTNGGSDSTVKELPHIVKVSGFSFTPIEEFRPSKQTIGPGATKGNIKEDTNFYGPERYIALATGKESNKNNYDDYENRGGISAKNQARINAQELRLLEQEVIGDVEVVEEIALPK